MPPLLLLLACAGPSDGAKDTGGADSDSAVDTGDSAETGDSDTSGEDTSDTSSDSGTDSDTAETGEKTGPVDADGDGTNVKSVADVPGGVRAAGALVLAGGHESGVLAGLPRVRAGHGTLTCAAM